RALRVFQRTKSPSLGVCLRCTSSVSAQSPAESSSTARLRFAPSPTGHLHLGGLRTALFNHLLARKWKGKWILRIEDTDRVRLVEGAADALRDILEWAGLDYDEVGVGRGGSHGPYIQSERLDIYRHHVDVLLSSDQAYHCFCTPDELLKIRQELLAKGARYPYDGRCRHLTSEDVQRRKRAGEKYTVRFKTPESVPRMPPDLVFGDVQIPWVEGQDDFIILKSDGWPTYHLASVVDDHLMEISHVLRGEEEWLPSTPKHHMLYEAFGWKSPKFAHLPLLVNADRSKLSKRIGDVRIDHYRQEGYEPEALLNFVALMGWDHHTAISSLSQEPEGLPPHSRHDDHSLYEVFSVPQLIEAFELKDVNHRKAAVNLSKLDFLNKMTLRRKAGRLGEDGLLVNYGKVSDDEGKERRDLLKRLQRMLKAEDILKDNDLVEDINYVEKVFDSELPRIRKLNEIPTSSTFFFLEPNYDTVEARGMLRNFPLESYGKSYSSLGYISTDGKVNNIKSVLRALNDRLEVSDMSEDLVWEAINEVLIQSHIRKRSVLLMPMRHALTGCLKGPSVPSTMSVLGSIRSLARLRAGLDYV
ncbi:hypothetical protein TREMEDRAFT_13793, partial [Tremella mesenterica DSM 1558]|uniref:uncharacterized protein n=1 Tax=Tremella mesenterica (strain ATCC 24925 / CBS 8224 / DSM 1558 / NBRC 9311 / NRRL Y-6157 / RJB 2259-6 / UBC 559-6) TaxID=578456 RepID=UPI0003F497C6